MRVLVSEPEQRTLLLLLLLLVVQQRLRVYVLRVLNIHKVL